MKIPTVSAEDLALCRKVLADPRSSASLRASAEKVLSNTALLQAYGVPADDDDPVLADGRRMSAAMGLSAQPSATTGVRRTDGGFSSEFQSMDSEAAARRLRELEGR